MSLVELPEEERVDAPPADRVSVSRTWLVAGIVGVVALLLGGAGGYTLALTAFDRGVDEAVSEVSSQVAAEFAAMMQDAPGTVAEVQPTPAPSRLDNVSADDDPYLGPEDAPVVIVEFSDFRCPYCKRFKDETLPLLLEEYEGQIRFVYRDYPVVGGGAAALASECANEQGEYWAYHDALFADPQRFSSQEEFVAVAGELGLDTESFQTCLETEATLEEVTNDFNDGRAYGVTGTPTFFINGVRLVGAQPLSAFQAIIDEELAAAQ